MTAKQSTTQYWLEKFESAITELELLEEPTEFDTIMLRAYRGQAETLRIALRFEQEGLDKSETV